MHISAKPIIRHKRHASSLSRKGEQHGNGSIQRALANQPGPRAPHSPVKKHQLGQGAIQAAIAAEHQPGSKVKKTI